MTYITYNKLIFLPIVTQYTEVFFKIIFLLRVKLIVHKKSDHIYETMFLFKLVSKKVFFVLNNKIFSTMSLYIINIYVYLVEVDENVV